VVGGEGEGEGNSGEFWEAEVSRSEPAKPARAKKEGAHCARVTGLPSRHVAQRPRRCQKNSSRSRSCCAERHTRARVAATHARAPARAVGRRNGGSNPERRGPPNPKRFQPETILPPRKARSFRSLRIDGPFCPCLTPRVSQTTRPPTKCVSDPKRVCQPGSFAPPPPQLDRFSSSSSSSFRCLPGSL
jgi:hypothetical protein